MFCKKFVYILKELYMDKLLLKQSVELVNIDDDYEYSKYMEETGLKSYIADNMLTYGGSFVKALSQCLITADNVNRYRLVCEFKKYFNEYLPHFWLTKGKAPEGANPSAKGVNAEGKS